MYYKAIMSRGPIAEHIPIPVREAARELGALIEIARRERGFTQAALGERVGVRRTTISRIERGDPGVALGWVLTAAWVLGLPVLRSADFASGRTESAVAAFLARMDSALPRHVKDTRPVDDDF